MKDEIRQAYAGKLHRTSFKAPEEKLKADKEKILDEIMQMHEDGSIQKCRFLMLPGVTPFFVYQT